MRKSEIILAIVLVLSAFIILASRIGSTHFLTVLSGSMSPTINMGDLVIVAPTNPQDIKINDIIAFNDADKKFPVTHRVINITQNGFVTKGDANEDPDARIVKPNEVIGKYSFRVPFAGYFVYYARTKYGFIFLILIPGALLIFSEVRKILAYVKEKKVKARGKRAKGSIPLSTILALFLVLLTSFSLAATKTNAYFSDIEVSSGNAFTAWTEEVPPVTVNKWWSDTEFNLISEFKVVTLEKSNRIVATNPGGFYINIEIANIPETDSFSLIDIISGAIRPRGDFVEWPPYHGLHVYLDSNDITRKFDYTFNGTMLNVTLKQGEILPKGEKLYVTFHLRYALIGTKLNESEKEMFPHVYSNRATVTIDSETVESSPADLTAYLKFVECKCKGHCEIDDMTIDNEILGTLQTEDCEFECIKENITIETNSTPEETSTNETQSIGNLTSFNTTENITLNETDSQNITDNSTSKVEDENSTSETQIINNSTLSNETIDNSTLNETENITTEINITENNSTENSTPEINQILNNITEDSYLSNRTEAVSNDSLDEVEDSSQVSDENSTEILLNTVSIVSFISIGFLSKRKNELLK